MSGWRVDTASDGPKQTVMLRGAQTLSRRTIELIAIWPTGGNFNALIKSKVDVFGV
jgi:hypothetical protein